MSECVPINQYPISRSQYRCIYTCINQSLLMALVCLPFCVLWILGPKEVSACNCSLSTQNSDEAEALFLDFYNYNWAIKSWTKQSNITIVCTCTTVCKCISKTCTMYVLAFTTIHVCTCNIVMKSIILLHVHMCNYKYTYYIHMHTLCTHNYTCTYYITGTCTCTCIYNSTCTTGITCIILDTVYIYTCIYMYIH